ncbi:MAG TPA: DUF3465 domain-containing protein [Sulfurovum sp.]|uniref:DUF3465 domain-containing protein n=1 Tax=Sulfurovum sp. TaxID=1969726 RepID=UPI002F93A376
MKKILYILMLSFIFVGCGSSGGSNTLPTENINPDTLISESDLILQDAYENGLSNIQVEGKGTVLTILADDTSGSQHQRFILLLSTDQTLLISHNIDLAPRVKNLTEDDSVAFYGEYEWNDKGGVIHWTHIDPNGIHEDGWLKHNGVVYQ